ncbi:hypothetical protein GGR53DRAFT_481316 [Hypoxylon sp. FL1150]|nr:hypothetical protein GGR53DRAFT_481316 [Hypoxylon sp. FL1150]
MPLQHEYSGFHVQPIEYPNGPNHLPEVHEPNHPPETFEYTLAPSMGVVKPGNLLQQQSSEDGNPFGLSPLAFGTLIALVTTLIVGAAIGGGLGSALAKKGHCDASPSVVTSMPTSTSLPTSSTVNPTSSTSAAATALVDYVAPEPSRVESLHINCPELDGTLIEDSNLDQYRVTCEQRILGNPSITTWSGLIAYSLQDCVQACFLLNNWGAGGQKACTAVSWCRTMSYSAEINAGANCWLFNSSSNSLEINSNHTVAVMQT